MGFNCLKATATSRRQFTFYHSVPRNSWYSFYRPWSHPVVLNTGTQFNTLYKLHNIVNKLYELHNIINNIYVLLNVVNTLYKLCNITNKLYELRNIINNIYALLNVVNTLYELHNLVNNFHELCNIPKSQNYCQKLFCWSCPTNVIFPSFMSDQI